MSSSYGEELETGPAARSGTAPVPHPTANARLDQPQSAPRPRLRALRAICRRVHPSRNDPGMVDLMSFHSRLRTREDETDLAIPMPNSKFSFIRLRSGP
jgi:hypothetical protein